jgi:hypothetical protein
MMEAVQNNITIVRQAKSERSDARSVSRTIPETECSGAVSLIFYPKGTPPKRSARKILERTIPETKSSGFPEAAHSGLCLKQDFIRNKKDHAIFFCGQYFIDILDRVSYSLNVNNQFLIKNSNGGLHER